MTPQQCERLVTVVEKNKLENDFWYNVKVYVLLKKNIFRIYIETREGFLRKNIVVVSFF